MPGAPERDLRREFRSLGITDRGRLMKELGNKIVTDFNGRMPANADALSRLPGVGRYTANAILCFGLRRDVPLLDTNVIRVLGRVFSACSDRPRARDDLAFWEFAAYLVPRGKSVTYNRAILDLGALVCTARKPKCPACPLSGICDVSTRAVRKRSVHANT